MAIKVPSAAEVAEKWARITAQRSGDYKAGVTGAGSDWEKGATDAQAAFVAGVTSGNIGKMYAGGIKRAGSAKYERKATGVGADRFSGGVQAAVGDMQSGVDPFLATIAGIDLGKRGMRGDAMNLERVRKIDEALFKKRLALRSAGV